MTLNLSVSQPLSLLLGNSTAQCNFLLCVLSHRYTSWLRYSALGTPWHNLNTACTLQLVISQVSSNLEHNPLFLHMVLLERQVSCWTKSPFPRFAGNQHRALFTAGKCSVISNISSCSSASFRHRLTYISEP